MNFANLFVAVVIPNFGNARITTVAEDFFSGMIEAAEGDIAVDQHRERTVDTHARFADLPIAE